MTVDCLAGLSGFTLHRMQPNQRGDYHDHDEMEQLYYFTEGAGQMQIDGEVRTRH